METTLIFSIILLILAYTIFSIVGISMTDRNSDAVSRMFFCIIGGILLCVAISLSLKYKEQETAIKALQGNNPYKMEIRYEMKDSAYVPKDTIYIRK